MLMIAIATLLRDLLATLFASEAHDAVKNWNTKAANKHRDILKEEKDLRWEITNYWCKRKNALRARKKILDYCNEHRCSVNAIPESANLEYSLYVMKTADNYGVHYDKIDDVPWRYRDKTKGYGLL